MSLSTDSVGTSPSCSIILDPVTDRRCPATIAIVDTLRYTDLLAGRRIVKARVRCAHGHSTWIVVDFGPIEDGVTADAPAAPPDLIADEVVVPPRPASPGPGRGGLRPGSGRRAWVWTLARRDTLARLWNGGVDAVTIAAELGISTHSVRGMVSEMRRRYPALGLARRTERAQVHGARPTARR